MKNETTLKVAGRTYTVSDDGGVTVDGASVSMGSVPTTAALAVNRAYNDLLRRRDAAPLTVEESAWLDESGRFVRMVVQDQDGARRRIQGIGAPKTSVVLGKARNGRRL